MTQKDVLLRFEHLCSPAFIKQCDDQTSNTMLTKEVDMTPQEYWEYLVLHKVKKNMKSFVTDVLKTTIRNDGYKATGNYGLESCPECKHKDCFFIQEKENIYICFSCDAHGNLIELINKADGIDQWSGYSRDFTDEQLKEVLKIAVPSENSICSVAVPAACHRIKCFKEPTEEEKAKSKQGTYETCRMLAFVLTQQNESGFWLKLPCSLCDEKTKLHEVTEAFVYDEGRHS